MCHTLQVVEAEARARCTFIFHRAHFTYFNLLLLPAFHHRLVEEQHSALSNGLMANQSSDLAHMSKVGSRSSGSPKVEDGIKGTAKKINTFSNDGSFLARFQQLKADDKGSPSAESAVERKKIMEDRFRNRGKKRSSGGSAEPHQASPEARSSSAVQEEDPTSTKRQRDTKPNEDSEYLREVRNLEKSSLKDSGAGVRALVK